MDETEHVRIPPEFFAKTLKEYQDWRFAWFRETAQNAADAGATQIDFVVEQRDDELVLSVTDNGVGMDEPTLRKGLLTLGGSVKSDEDSIIGGYGYAKHIILFAHRGYRIQTRDLDVSGTAGAFRIEHADQWTQGTCIEVWLQDQPGRNFCRACRTLVHQFETDTRIMLNGKRVHHKKPRFDHSVETPLGMLRFSENDSSSVTLWVRMRGLPMFQYYVGHSGYRGFDGVLDLQGAPTELLTSNRDGLIYQARCQLDELLMSLISQRHQFKTRNKINLIVNPTDQAQHTSASERTHEQTEVQHPFQDLEVELQARIRRAIAKLGQLAAFATYPENFHLHVADIALRQAKGQHDQLTIPRVRRLLQLKRNKKLAWIWTLAVQWVLESKTLNEQVGVRWDEEADRYYFVTEAVPFVPVDVGFVFDDDVTGLHKRSAHQVAILLNPAEFQRDWLIGDLLDVAIHECAHLVEPSHGELFTQVEAQIRRDLRRIVTEPEVLKDARDAMHEVGLR